MQLEKSAYRQQKGMLQLCADRHETRPTPVNVVNETDAQGASAGECEIDWDFRQQRR